MADLTEQKVVPFNGHRCHPHIVTEHNRLTARRRRLLRLCLGLFGLLWFGKRLAAVLVGELLSVVAKGLLLLAMTVAVGGLLTTIALRMENQFYLKLS